MRQLQLRQLQPTLGHTLLKTLSPFVSPYGCTGKDVCLFALSGCGLLYPANAAWMVVQSG
jgi:hypothetical protein